MEFNDQQPIYLQIADLFCENILSKKWQQGDRIPSVREMAVSVEVNPNTMMRTFSFLQERGIIFNKRGIGYFVSDDGFKKTKDLIKEGFIKEELPKIFRQMQLLDMDLSDLEKYYHSYLKEETNDNH